jgi:hypothetical protein
LILAINEKKSETTCSLPATGKQPLKPRHQDITSFLYVGCPIKIEHISVNSLQAIFSYLLLEQISIYNTSFFPPSAMCFEQSWIKIVIGGVTPLLAKMFRSGIQWIMAPLPKNAKPKTLTSFRNLA